MLKKKEKKSQMYSYDLLFCCFYIGFLLHCILQQNCQRSYKTFQVMPSEKSENLIIFKILVNYLKSFQEPTFKCFHKSLCHSHTHYPLVLG